MPTWLEQFSRDAQFGFRGLVRTPAFTALAVMSLALGIMATTAIYSVLHAVVLDPFPYRDVDRLMSVRVSSPATRGGRISYSLLLLVIGSLACYWPARRVARIDPLTVIRGDV